MKTKQRLLRKIKKQLCKFGISVAAIFRDYYTQDGTLCHVKRVSVHNGIVKIQKYFIPRSTASHITFEVTLKPE